MIRDFTEATKNRLLNEIDDINQNTWNPVTDAIGDVLMYAGKGIGIISLNEDMSNVKAYQRSVLDMTDTTKKELQQIFDDVYDLDNKYSGMIADINTNEDVYNDKIKYLCSIIRPNFTICDAKTIRAQTEKYNDKLEAIGGKINSNFEKEIDAGAKDAALEATKGLVNSLIKTAVDIVLLPVNMAQNLLVGNYAGVFADTWAIIDDTFAIGSNLVGISVIGLGYGVSAISGNNKSLNKTIEYSEAYGGVTGLTELLEAEEKLKGEGGITSGMKKISKKIDNASAAVDICNSAKSFVEDPTSMIDIKFGFNEKLEPLKKADMLDEYKSDYEKWQALYKQIGEDSYYTEVKNISKGYEYMKGIWEASDGTDAVIENEAKTVVSESNKWFEALGKTYDLSKNIG